jgi:hypothetical protein
MSLKLCSMIVFCLLLDPSILRYEDAAFDPVRRLYAKIG